MKKNIFLLEPQVHRLDNYNFTEFYQQKLNNPNFYLDCFSSDLKSFLKTEKRICLLNSGTSALHLSLVHSGINKEDVVFCSNSTFIATVNSILYTNALPCFVDIDLNTGNMNMEYLEIAIVETIKSGKTPKAIIITHSYGVPANMDKLLELKIKYNLIIIEDAAEALGAKYKNISCGTIADYGIISFNSNKMNTSFGGGALIVKNEEVKREIDKYANQYKVESFDFKHLKLGYNYRLNDLAAYLGSIQLKFIYKELARKQEIHQEYKKLLGSKLMSIKAPSITSNYWLNCVKIKENSFQKIYQQFLKEKIEIRRVWFPLNLQPYLRKYPLYGNNESKVFYDSTICVPSSGNLTFKSIKKISTILLND